MSNGLGQGKTITLNDIEIESLTFTREGENIRIDCRFLYLDSTGEKVMFGGSPARDYVRETLPVDSPVLSDIVTFVNSTVVPFIRQQKGLK